jgi:hypothetical protein
MYETPLTLNCSVKPPDALFYRKFQPVKFFTCHSKQEMVERSRSFTRYIRAVLKMMMVMASAT